MNNNYLNNDIEIQEKINAIEAILFASGEPVSINVIKDSLEISKDLCKEYLEQLIEEYDTAYHGFHIINMDNKYQMVTKVGYYPYIQKVIKSSATANLSNAALETLSIVAYKQPVTRADIEYIRGVQSSSSLDLLIDRGLVKLSGKLDMPGRPFGYITTDEFLKFMKINNLDELPSFEYFRDMIVDDAN